MILGQPSPQNDVQKAEAYPIYVLGAAGFISALIYLQKLVQPYGLLQWWERRHVSVESMIGLDPDPERAYVLAFAIVFILYAVALIAVRLRSDRQMWALIIAGAAAFNLILLFLYPFDATDIFDDIMRGRMQSIYHANPFYDLPLQFKGDGFFPYALWVHSTSAYGPLWEMTALVASSAAGSTVISNVLVFKLVGIAGYAATGVLIALTLRRQMPERALFGMTLFAWNPLVLSSTAGNGHNDAIMVAFMILGFYFLAARRFTLAALAETAGVLVKFIPALLMPIVVVAGLRAEPDWKRRFRFLIVTGLACGALAAGAYLPYWHGGDILALGRRTDMFTTSLPTLVRFALMQEIGHQADKVVAYGALAITALWVAWQTWRSSRDSRPDAAARAGLSVLLFYLLVTCLWFQPWYLTWVMALAPLVFSEVLTWGSVLFSAAAYAQLPLFYLVLYRGHEKFPKPFTDLYEAGATLGLCWAYFGIMGIRQIILRYRDRARTA